MKQSRVLLLFILLLYELLSPCTSSEIPAKTILVTYIDRIISRAPIATLSGSYRRSNNYYSSTWSRNLAVRLAQQYQLTIQAEWPISELGVQCVVYKITDDRTIDTVLESLAKNKQVESVQRMGIFNLHTANPDNSNPGYLDLNRTLQTNLETLSLDDVHRRSTGKGISIALIDTGIDINHPDLEGQISSTLNLVDGVSNSFTEDAHGTAVAGVIAARADNNIGSVGIAPDSRIVALKACWPLQKGGYQASCNSLSLSMAINQAIKMGVDIINLSLSGPPDPLVSRLINQAIAHGIIVVAADHGTDQNVGKSFPASMDAVIAARHVQKKVDASIPASHQSIAVPSADILTTLPQGKYDLVSGCSIAAAQVSGIVALLLEIKPGLSPSEIQDLFVSTQKKRNSQATGEVDLHALISRVHDHQTDGG
ncbi:MAG TPA: serine protease [Crenotrichaceae bacterium]|nr:serine protease [Crenotrichaceae bacterium]